MVECRSYSYELENGVCRMKITGKDKKRYVLKEDRDYKILGLVYELEKCKLSAEDKLIVALIRTQLEHDWRKPLLKYLGQLLRKYK